MNKQPALRFVLLILFFVSCTCTAFSQQAPCAHILDSVKNYIEKNYVGFADKVNPATQEAYQAHTRQAYDFAGKAQSNADYYFVINYWLQFFKDHHIYINPPADTINIEKVIVDGKQLARLNNQPALAIEGIYYTGDSTYKIAVVKSYKGLRSYAGVILASRISMWKRGQVKFELIKTGATTYTGIWYLRDHSLYMSDVSFTKENGLVQEGWFKKGIPVKDNAPVNTTPLFREEERVNCYFKKLNDSTGYIRIQSFDLSNAHDIDSVIKTNTNSIQSMPRLVIDLRYNGGGSDHCMSLLKPIVYTNPVKNIGVNLLATPDNITAWEYMINKYRNALPKAYLDTLLEKIYTGKGKERADINFAADYTETLPAVWPNPSKIAIVINHGCGSSTEEFLLFAQQSKKVVMVGEHSQGVLDYSNVVYKDFACPPFPLRYPTTRSRRIDAGLGIDNIGITPNIPLDVSSNNWLSELLKKW